MGRRNRRGRAVHGILLLDKDSGMSSNRALQRVKRLFGAAKAGHTGSLDPLATGLLPICLGEATKVSAFLLEADKRYRFTARLGELTDSGDADGERLATRSVSGIDSARIEAALEGLRGEIEQLPPMHSALKHAGRPLYEYARRGIEIERSPRPTVIYDLELLAFDGRDAELEVYCAKGTYVRTLAEDLGAALGCGAHVTALRRTGAGPFGDEALTALAELEADAEADGGGPQRLDRHLLPIDSALMAWPRLDLGPDLAGFIRQGQAVQVSGAPTAGLVRLYGRDGGFLGMGRIASDGRVAPKRLMNQ
ncbi:MAG: tRNA pseudouridine(55) synthase TruB [Halofilum sp. (in: g-proteobacteria)]